MQKEVATIKADRKMLKILMLLKSNKTLDTTINKEIASKSSNADKDSVGDRRMMMKFLCNEAK